jgi:hypothetical protein
MKFSIQGKTKQNKLGKKKRNSCINVQIFQSSKIFTIYVCETKKNIILLPKAYKEVYMYKERDIGERYK